jgi:hypothetical protein
MGVRAIAGGSDAEFPNRLGPESKQHHLSGSNWSAVTVDVLGQFCGPTKQTRPAWSDELR